MGKKITPFRDGERIVCLGDSTTHDGYWLYYLSEYVLTHTGCKVDFINAGVSGGNATGGLVRLGYDVICHRPSRVIINFGMNDVDRLLYNAKETTPELAAQRQQKLDIFRTQLNSIIELLQKEKIDVILMTTLPFDEYQPDNPAESGCSCCNSLGLSRLNEIVKELAVKFELPLIDIFTPLTQLYRNHPDFQITVDRVHPKRFGYLLMAAKIVETIWGAQELGAFSLSPNGCECRKLTINSVCFSATGCSFLWIPGSLPFFRDSDYRLAAQLYDLDKMLNTENWRIAGLPGERYRLRIGGNDCGIFYASELASGINSTTLPTPAATAAANIAALLNSLNRVDLLQRRLVQCELIVRERGEVPADAEKTRQILEHYLGEIADTPYCGYYRSVFSEYWKLRDSREEFIETRKNIVAALFQNRQSSAYPVELMIDEKR